MDGRNPDDIRPELLRYLADVRAHYAAYHNHKEATAWAATGLYLLLVAQLVKSLADKPPVSCAAKGVISVVVVVVASLFVMYLRRQFTVTRRASGYVGACFQLGSRLLSDPSYMPSRDELAPEVDEASWPPIQSRFSLPKVLISTSGTLANKALPNRRSLEALAYALILVGGSVPLLQLWLFCAN